MEGAGREEEEAVEEKVEKNAADVESGERDVDLMDHTGILHRTFGNAVPDSIPQGCNAYNQ